MQKANLLLHHIDVSQPEKDNIELGRRLNVMYYTLKEAFGLVQVSWQVAAMAQKRQGSRILKEKTYLL